MNLSLLPPLNLLKELIPACTATKARWREYSRTSYSVSVVSIDVSQTVVGDSAGGSAL